MSVPDSRLGRAGALLYRRARWVLLGWVLVTAGLALGAPTLEHVAARDATPFVPGNAPSVRGFERMDTAFGLGRGKALAFVVLTDRHGLSAADVGYYAALVGRLRSPNPHVAEVQDFRTQPQLRGALVSRDGRATYLPVAIRHPVGSPQAAADVQWLRRTLSIGRPPDLQGYVAGDPATVADLSGAVNRSVTRLTIVTVAVIAVILFLLYRTPVTPLVPLVTIGVALGAARGVVALLGEHVFNVSTYTGAFVTAIVLGAGTDYSVFLISRYHERLRAGDDRPLAAATSLARVGTVICASAATVVIGSVCMVVTRLALFRTTGPAIAASVAVTLVVALTLTPALLALAGRWALPRAARRPAPTALSGPPRGWAAVGGLVARRPVLLALGCLALLGVLAAAYPSLRPTYDVRQLQPSADQSNIGYRVLARHFTWNELLPDYLVVSSAHDLRDPRALAALDALTGQEAKVPGVLAVRSLTRPFGATLPAATLPYQVELVGQQLAAATHRLGAGSPAAAVAAGSARLAAGAGAVSGGAGQAAGAVGTFLAALAAEQQGLAGAAGGAAATGSGAAQLAGAADILATALQSAHDQTATGVSDLGLVHRELSLDGLCSLDPVCSRARTAIGRIYAAQHDQLLPGLAQAAAAARRIGAGDGQVSGALQQLAAGLGRADAGIASLRAGERVFGSKLGRLATGAAELERGLGGVPDGVRQIGVATGQLRAGLAHAAAFLDATAQRAGAAGVGGFVVPPSALSDPRFATARAYYLSPDGHTARLLVFAADPTGPGAPQRMATERAVAQLALRGTPLAHAALALTGSAAVDRDMQTLSGQDFRLVLVVVLAAVLLILVALLRSLVAPLYLLASVVLSYAAAMGVTTLVFQDLLHRPIDWTMPLLAFVILVAVGADYNIFLMSRVREESRRATRAGVSRAVAATGGVITSAGLIFAGTFVAMTTSSLVGLEETGFGIAVGLLLDTFVVRSLLVPSLAALLGPVNWWPARQAEAEPAG